MLHGRTLEFVPRIEDNNLKEILKLAQSAHEKYLLRASKVDLENAIDYYTKAMNLNPSLAESYYKLASLKWEKGLIDIETAISQCQKAVELDSKCHTARLYLGYFLKIAAQYSKAQKQFKRSIELNRFLSSRARLALTLTLIEKSREEKISFGEFIQIAHYAFSGTVMMLWDYSSIRMLYKCFMEDFSVFAYRALGMVFKTVRSYDMAVKTYESAAENTAKSEMFYTKMGDLSLAKGKPEMAVRSYKKALKSKPNNSILWVKLATTLQAYFDDNTSEIANCYNSLAMLEPNNSHIYYELGHLYIKLEDKFSTVNAFKKAVELEPENPFYHNSLAYALLQLDDFDGAIEHYQQAIKLNPDNEWTSVVAQAQGAVYHQIKFNLEAAIVAYQSAIMLDPKNADAFFSIGEVYQDNNELDKAIDSYCEAIKLDPESVKPYCNLGLALWEKDCIDEAIVAFQKAIDLDPDYEIGYNNIGVIYLDGVGDVDDALMMFNRAIDRNPNYTMAYYNRGRCHQALGNNSEAAEDYQMAINLNKLTDEIDSDEAEERLYSLFSV